MRKEHLSASFLERFEHIKHHLQPMSDLVAYFAQEQINHKRMQVVSAGTIDITSGQICIADPCTDLPTQQCYPYYEQVPLGNVPVQLALVELDNSQYVAAARIKFQESSTSLKYYNALIGDENLDVHFDSEHEGKVFFGFNVDTGLAAICDRATQKAFHCFYEKACEQSDDGFCNFYDEYLDDLFDQEQESYSYRVANFAFNHEGQVHNICIFDSGFGDGHYPAYFGYDSEGKVCELIVQFIQVDELENV